MISATRCTCEVQLGGRCSHVACLLYFIEAISLKAEPIIKQACTSTPQAWGRGKKQDKNPDAIHKKFYDRKLKPDKYIAIGM